MSEEFSKSIMWDRLLNICQPKAESKELLELFEKSSLISNDLGIKQVVRESIEINLKINNNISLKRDLGGILTKFFILKFN